MLWQANNEHISSTEIKNHVIDVMEINLQQEFTEFTKIVGFMISFSSWFGICSSDLRRHRRDLKSCRTPRIWFINQIKSGIYIQYLFIDSVRVHNQLQSNHREVGGREAMNPLNF